MLLQQSANPIEKEVYRFLWGKYVQDPAASDPTKSDALRCESRAALQLLAYCSRVFPAILDGKKHELMEYTLHATQCHEVDWMLFREEISAFQRITTNVEQEDVEFLNSAMKALIRQRKGSRRMEWFCAAEEVVNTVFALLDYPERHSEFLIHELSRGFVGPKAVPGSGVKEPASQDSGMHT